MLLLSLSMLLLSLSMLLLLMLLLLLLLLLLLNFTVAVAVVVVDAVLLSLSMLLLLLLLLLFLNFSAAVVFVVDAVAVNAIAAPHARVRSLSPSKEPSMPPDPALVLNSRSQQCGRAAWVGPVVLFIQQQLGRGYTVSASRVTMILTGFLTEINTTINQSLRRLTHFL